MKDRDVLQADHGAARGPPSLPRHAVVLRHPAQRSGDDPRFLAALAVRRPLRPVPRVPAAGARAGRAPGLPAPRVRAAGQPARPPGRRETQDPEQPVPRAVPALPEGAELQARAERCRRTGGGLLPGLAGSGRGGARLVRPGEPPGACRSSSSATTSKRTSPSTAATSTTRASWPRRTPTRRGPLAQPLRPSAEPARRDREAARPTWSTRKTATRRRARSRRREPALTLQVEAGRIRLDYRNLKGCTLNFYPMDIELLFSRSPFLQEGAAQFSFIRPVLSQRRRPAGRSRTRSRSTCRRSSARRT